MWWGRFSILCQWFAHLYIIFSQRILGTHRVWDFSSTSSSVKRKDFSFCFFPCCCFAPPPFYFFFFFDCGKTNFKSFFHLPVQRDPTGYCKIVNSGAGFGGCVNASLESWPCLQSVAGCPLLLMILHSLPVLQLPVPGAPGVAVEAWSWKICEQ